jgi:hypothetical protein
MIELDADVSTIGGLRCVADLLESFLAPFAEFEVDLLRLRDPRRHGDRQVEGQTARQTAPTHRRHHTHLVQLHTAGEHTIAELFAVSRATVYRVPALRSSGRCFDIIVVA